MDTENSQAPLTVSNFVMDLYLEQCQSCKISKGKFKVLNVSAWRFALLLKHLQSAF